MAVATRSVPAVPVRHVTVVPVATVAHALAVTAVPAPQAAHVPVVTVAPVRQLAHVLAHPVRLVAAVHARTPR